MTWNTKIAQVTVFERGAILAMQFTVGWNRIPKIMAGKPLRRFDVCILSYWAGFTPFPITEHCGCSGYICGCFGFMTGWH